MATPTSPKQSSKRYKVWAITATVLGTVMAVMVVILAIMLATTSCTNSTSSGSDQTADTTETDDENYESVEVDISTLDGSKLITKNDLANGEIPDHYIGNKNAKVVVIEYEDFACSHCQHLAADAERIHADYKTRVLFIHRSFNLGFPNSERTLRAAEAAYRLGGEEAYWAMSKLLYQDNRWTAREEVFGSRGILDNFAKQIGLNADEFRKAISDSTVSSKITRDRKLGAAIGVGGTPTWFINGQQVMPRDADIRAALDAAL